MNILELTDLNVKINQSGDFLLQDVSFTLKKNSCLAIVGESGSGKTMTCKTILGVTDKRLTVSGQVIFEGQNLIGLKESELAKIRGRNISMILQNSMSAFNPLFTIGEQMRETLKKHFNIPKSQAHVISKNSLDKMALLNPEDILQKRPHQLSGGMLQRVMCALALALEPKIIIADEPTTAIDVITQHEIIKEFCQLREKSRSALIFVTHDLAVARKIAQEVVVMKTGKVVEQGAVEQVFDNPQHEYTKFLVNTRRLLGDKFKARMVSA